MNNRTGSLVFACFLLWLALPSAQRSAAQEDKILPRDQARALEMLADMRDAVRKNYYDPTLHGIDLDARYATYKERIEKAQTLADAFRTIAAFMSGFDDSHTFFIPPNRSYRSEYGYRLQMIGERCYVTELRPGTDAAEKLHMGDQVISLDGFKVDRTDLWQLNYFLHQLAPKPSSEFTLRSPDGVVRKEQVSTKYVQGKRMKDMTLEHGDNDIYNVIFEEDKERHLLRSRYIEHGDLMIWKMPAFVLSEGEVDHLMGIARKHKGLIIDLRDDPGGYEFALLRIIGNVFNHEIRVGTRVTRKGEKPMVAKSRGNSGFEGDLVVLIDSSSASAAELFARVIQLEHRGKVIGDRSSGSVMEALDYPFKAGADFAVFYEASVTRANLVMTDGKSLEKNGVTPDIVLVPTGQDLASGQDPVLAQAAELLGVKLDPAEAGKLFPYEWVPMP